jgi:septal ring factor EnvC (AmiA/AmiB activator)
MWIKKVLLLSCLLLLFSSTCSAYTMTEAQAQRFETALQGLKVELTTLKQNYNLSEEKLNEAKKRQQNLEQALKNSQTSIDSLEKLLTEAKIELVNLKNSCEKLERENKLLKFQRIILGVAALFFAVK